MTAQKIFKSDLLLIFQVLTLSYILGLYNPQSRHILNLSLHLNRLEYHLLPVIYVCQTQKVIALDVRKPYYLSMSVELLLLLICRVVVKLQLGTQTKPQKQQILSFLLLRNHHPLPRLSILS